MPLSRLIPTKTRLLLATIFFRAWILEGRLKNTSIPVSVLYGGFAEHLAYLKSLIFDSEPVCRSLGRMPSWRIPYMVEELGPDLVFLPAHEALRHLPQHQRRFRIPCWISGEIDTGIDYFKPPWKKGLADDLRKIRKYGYTSDVSRDPGDLEEYYHSMYLPLLRRSHSESALPIEWNEMKSIIRQGGELVFCLCDQERVGGEVVMYEAERPVVRALGIKDGSRELLKQGVAAACYLNTIQHVRKRGFARLHWGGTRAFLRDGVLRYKKKWGFRLTGHDESGHYLWAPTLSASARRFLEDNPFVHVKEDGLWAAVFQDETRGEPSAPDAGIEKLLVRGLAGGQGYRLGEGITLHTEVSQKLEARRGVSSPKAGAAAGRE